MRSLLVIITPLILSANSYAAVDYSYCQQQFNTMSVANKLRKPNLGIYSSGKKSKNTSYYPFELTTDGKIIPHPALVAKSEKGVDTFISKNKKSGIDSETIVTRNENGEPVKVVTTLTSLIDAVTYDQKTQEEIKSPIKKIQVTTTNIEIKNGKCVPSRVDVLKSMASETRQEVHFDLGLCKSVGDFFKQNPKAASCFDKKLMDKAQSIFGDYYKRNNDLYGGAENEWSKPKTLKNKSALDGSNDAAAIPPAGMGLAPSPGFPAPTIGLMNAQEMGQTADQMVLPDGVTVDSLIQTPTYDLKGFGNSAVVSAIQINSMCESFAKNNSNGNGRKSPSKRNLLTDGSLWVNDTNASKVPTTTVISK